MNIADHLWQSTLFAAAVGLLNWTLRGKRARVRHGLWLAASAKFLVPFSLLIVLGGHIPWTTTPHRISTAVAAFSEPFRATIAATLPATSPLPAVLLAIWAAGILAIACSWWVRWRRIEAAVRTGSPLDVAAPLRAVQCATALEPGVFGIVRPVLMLPAGIREHLTPAQLDAVVAHEFQHVRYRDNLSAAFQMFVETVFWFHPLVWWMGKRMVDERERACDEAVLRAGCEPRMYAEAILNVCKFYTESPLACLSGVTGANLKQRIEAIMSRNVASDLRSIQKLALAIAAMAAVAAPIVIGMLHAPVARAQAADARAHQSSPHASISVHAGKQNVTLAVPLNVNGLTGRVDIIGSVLANGQSVAHVRDSAEAGAGAKKSEWRSAFILDPGAYTCRLMVREVSSGRLFTDTLAFEVK